MKSVNITPMLETSDDSTWNLLWTLVPIMLNQTILRKLKSKSGCTISDVTVKNTNQ